MYGANSVFASPMAQDWLTLLLALEQTHQQSARQAALTCFFGWTFADLAGATEESLIELTQRIRWWGKVLKAVASPYWRPRRPMSGSPNGC